MINTFFLISDHAPFGFCSQNTCNIYTTPAPYSCRYMSSCNPLNQSSPLNASSSITWVSTSLNRWGVISKPTLHPWLHQKTIDS